MFRQIEVNGFPVEAISDSALITDSLLPRLASMSPRPGAARAFAFLAGPPGCGKSTLAELIRNAAADDSLDLDVIGMDGFHYTNQYLSHHSGTVNGRQVRLSDVKGAPETFDLPALRHRLERCATETVKWPEYDRRCHDPVDGPKPVRASRVLLEGNWLLLDEPGWSDLHKQASLTIRIDAAPDLLKERLIARKCAGGTSRPDAEKFYHDSDLPNVHCCLEHSIRDVDVILTLRPDGHLEEATS